MFTIEFGGIIEKVFLAAEWIPSQNFVSVRNALGFEALLLVVNKAFDYWFEIARLDCNSVLIKFGK